MTSQPIPIDHLPASDQVRRLDLYLRTNGIDHEFLAPGTPMPTVPLAAAAIGVTEDQIIKSLLFEDRNHEVALVIASGPTRIDKQALAAATGFVGPRLAKPDTVLRMTGFAAGGVAPVGHISNIPVLIDDAVMKLDVVYGGGGAEDVLLRIRPADIVRLTNADIVFLTSNSDH